MISINPLNNKKYKIPDKLDDKKHIDDFLKNNKNKKVVLVQGLGFVGSVMSLVCANSLSENYAVIGVDRKENIQIIDVFVQHAGK